MSHPHTTAQASIAWVLDEVADAADKLPTPHSFMVEPTGFTYRTDQRCELTIHVASDRAEDAAAWATWLGIGPLVPTDHRYATGRREYRAEGMRWGWKVAVWYTVTEPPTAPVWHCPSCATTVTADDPAALVDASMRHAREHDAYTPPPGEVVVATIPGPVVRDERPVSEVTGAIASAAPEAMPVCDRCGMPAAQGIDGRWQHAEPADGVACSLFHPGGAS